jgi:hypothetical protein
MSEAIFLGRDVYIIYLHYTAGHCLCLSVHGSALRGDWCTAGCEAHTNFAAGLLF